MYFKHLLLGAALVLATGGPATGCAAALPFVVQAASVIADVAHWVDLIAAQAETAKDAGLLPADWAERVARAF